MADNFDVDVTTEFRSLIDNDNVSRAIKLYNDRGKQRIDCSRSNEHFIYLWAALPADVCKQYIDELFAIILQGGGITYKLAISPREGKNALCEASRCICDHWIDHLLKQPQLLPGWSVYPTTGFSPLDYKFDTIQITLDYNVFKRCKTFFDEQDVSVLKLIHVTSDDVLNRLSTSPISMSALRYATRYGFFQCLVALFQRNGVCLEFVGGKNELDSQQWLQNYQRLDLYGRKHIAVNVLRSTLVSWFDSVTFLINIPKPLMFLISDFILC